MAYLRRQSDRLREEMRNKERRAAARRMQSENENKARLAQMQREHEEQMRMYSAQFRREAQRKHERTVFQVQMQARESERKIYEQQREMRQRDKAALEKIEKMRQNNEAEYRKLEDELRQKERQFQRKLEAQTAENAEKLVAQKIDSLQEMSKSVQTCIAEMERRHGELEKRHAEVAEKYAEQQKKVRSEETRLAKLGCTDVKNGHILVLLGRTGTGKSVLTNRLSGDDSKLGNKGLAKTSRSHKSCTTAPEIFPCKKFGGRTLYTVDSGGFADTEDRDEDHTNMLCKFLRGCGGINAFVLTVNCADPRITRETKEALKVYEECFGADFYKRVIIVGTHVDADSPELDDWKDGTFGAKSLRTELVQALKLNENKQLSKSDRKGIPVVPIGVKNYTGAVTAIHSLLKTKLRFKITHPDLNSPLDKLEEKNQEILKSCEEVKEEMDQFVSEVSSLATRLDAVQKKIIEKGGIPSF